MAKSKKRPIPLAISYDFDGTLAPGNMQEFEFVPKIGMTSKKFWAEVENLAREQEADRILAYMNLMLMKAAREKVTVRRVDIKKYGNSVKLFAGVDEWFDRINEYGRLRQVRIKHYIISSGIREMILGSSIAKQFDAVFASAFMYDHHGIAYWPALGINYTTKTQYLFRINKGNLKVYDDSKINAYIPKPERPVPFENMVFIGDGETDIPCFRLVKEQGGHSIAVYKPNAKGAKARAQVLIRQQRVNFACPADYRPGRSLDLAVKAVIDKVAADGGLRRLGKKE